MRHDSEDLLLGSLAAVMVVIFLLTFAFVLIRASQPPFVAVSELLIDRSRQNIFRPIVDDVGPTEPRRAIAHEPSTTGQGGAH